MFGWFTRRHEDKLRWGNPERSQIMYLLPENPRDYLDSLSRQEIARRVEWLMERFGLVKEGVLGIARHTVGTGLTLQLNSSDLLWNAEAEQQFLLYSLTKSRFDLAGRRDFYQAQRTAPEQLVLRGEFFSGSALNPRWNNEPCVQLFDTTEIRTPDELAEDPNVFDGVRLGPALEPLGYYVCKAGGGHDFIPVQQMVHWYEPTGINQIRGQSAFSPVVNKLVDWADLEKLVTQVAKTHSSLAIAVKKLAKIGGRGIVNKIKQQAGTSTDAAVDTQALEKAFPGLVSYLGADGEVQIINSQSPNEKLEPFLSNLIAPDVFLALGVPSEFFWNPAKLGGANNRFILARADLRFKTLADDLIYQFCNGVAYRFLSHRMQTLGADGKPLLRAPIDRDWASKMGWQKPARITVDNGRDGALKIQMLACGMTTLRNHYDENGESWRPQTSQWIREWLEFEAMCDEQKATPEQKARIVAHWRAGLPGAPVEASQQSQQTQPPAE